MAAIRLTRTHRILIGVVVTGAVVIAGIGFAGSYAAVRALALHKGFGWFANVFPVGVDAGIVVLLALDLLLTWLRIPFPLLRQTAWLLTGATIAFNGAAAWPDPLGVGMHAIIPVLFVVSVEAARHAIGRIADITADKHMESVRITRWLLAPVPTFRLWRRMKLWELRSYEETIRREQDRLVYRARLRARYGVAWRRRAPIEAIMPLRLAKYGVPLSETAAAGLEAAGIEIASPIRQLGAATPAGAKAMEAPAEQAPAEQAPAKQAPAEQAPAATSAAEADTAADAEGTPTEGAPAQPTAQEQDAYAQGIAHQRAYEQQMYEQQMHEQQAFEQQQYANAQSYYEPWQGAPHDSPWFAAQQRLQQQQLEQQYAQQAYVPQDPQDVSAQGQAQEQAQQGQGQPARFPQQPHPQQPSVRIPSGAPGRQRSLGNVGVNGLNAVNGFSAGPAQNGPHDAGDPDSGHTNGHTIPGPHAEDQPQIPLRPEPDPAADRAQAEAEGSPSPKAESEPVHGLGIPDEIPVEEAYYAAYRQYVREHSDFPNARQFARFLPTVYGGTAPEERTLVTAIRDMRYRFQSEADTEHIP